MKAYKMVYEGKDIDGNEIHRPQFNIGAGVLLDAGSLRR